MTYQYLCRSLMLVKYVKIIQRQLACKTYVKRCTGTLSSVQSHPYELVAPDLNSLCEDIKFDLKTSDDQLRDISHYHFDGKGKYFRPMIVLLMAKALNNGKILKSQKKIAQISEMIHVASLVHDDVIDASSTRRGKPSVHHNWGQRKAVVAGDFILSMASIALARLRNAQVVVVLAKVIEDLVKGEFMQLGSKENEQKRFSHYMEKTYKKTASLIANSCKAVAILGGADDDQALLAYNYGRHVGIAFQLVDDLLDFTSDADVMGKPTAADLRLGLATAPVLFASEQYPDLNALIMRRFKEEGDVEKARQYVKQSNGIELTRKLAESHCQQAVDQIKSFPPSAANDALVSITEMVLSRRK